jgi:hypothetical protein
MLGRGLIPSMALATVPTGPAVLTPTTVRPRIAEASVATPATSQAFPPLATTEYQRFVQDTTGRALPLFGYDLFTAGAFPSLQNVPVPTDYVLGPGR